MDEAATEPELLPHPARQILRLTVGKGGESGTLQKLRDSPFPLGTGLSEQPAKELDVLADTEVRIKVLTQSLRHIGDTGADRGPMRRILHVAVEGGDISGLHVPRASDDAEQRRFADAVGTDQADHAAGRQRDRHVIERRHTAVALGNVFEARDGHCQPAGRPAHCVAVPCGVAVPCSRSGHCVAASVKT